MWTVEFDADVAQAGRVRHGAERFLRGEGVADGLDDIELMLSELVTNAMLHATAPRRATLEVNANAVRVSVDDATSQQPRVLPMSPTRPGGNGMRIVSSLAARWGVTHNLVGKSVWFIVAR